MNAEVKQAAARIFPQVQAWRRQLHQYPELALKEHNTAQLVAKVLRENGYTVREGVGETGVVGILTPENGERKPAIALRADMDGLPLTELSAVPYRSQNPGVMHACGHDGHTACLLGTAVVLAQMRTHLTRPLVLIFQPAEERLAGARHIIRSGILEEFHVQEIFGMHLMPRLPKGEIGLRKGPIMAGQANFRLRVIGKGAHAAEPEQGVDTIVAGAAIITGLQTLVSRRHSPQEPLVLTIGSFHAGHSANIIAEEGVMEGTVRLTNEGLKAQIHAQMEGLVTQTAAAFGARAELDWQNGYPVTSCTPSCVDLIAQSAGTILGEHKVHWLPQSLMISEDFAYYLQKIPGAYFFLGIGDDTSLHSPTFDFDESVLQVGVNLWVNLVLTAMTER